MTLNLQNYSLGTLEAMIKDHPEMGALIPSEFLANFRNEFLMTQPDLMQRLSKERVQGTGQYAGTGFSPEVQAKTSWGGAQAATQGKWERRGELIFNTETGVGYSTLTAPPEAKAALGLSTPTPTGSGALSTFYGGPPSAPGGPAQGPMQDPAGTTGAAQAAPGLSPGAAGSPVWWGIPAQAPTGYRLPTWNELEDSKLTPGTGMNPGIGIKNPPRLTGPMTGKPYQGPISQGNVPWFSPQAISRLLPSDREALGRLVNQTGGRAEDFFNYSMELGAAPKRAGHVYGMPTYSGAPKGGGW